ncbi:MAG: peptide chain release factor N(5)-glutamine methyltransferase [Actinomycetota bacterium]
MAEPDGRPALDPDGDPDGGAGVTWAALAAETGERLAVSSDPAVAARADWQGRLIAMRAAGAEADEWPGRATEPATVRGVAALDRMTARRLSGEPLQYVLGEWSFRYLDLFVDHRVLIPRPETEVVADLALDELRRRAPGDQAVTAVDLGTGSGAIGLSLAREHDGVELWLTDISADALQVARANLAGLGRAAARVRVTQGAWFEALPDELRGAVGLVVANPPYVARDEDLPAEVAEWEPELALVSGPTGTEHLELLIAQAPHWLDDEGVLVLEMAPHQTSTMAALARTHFDEVEIHPDLAERDRAVLARRPRRRES